MKSYNLRGALLASTFIAGAFAVAAPAIAQDGDDANDDEIVVTGSRIPKKDFTSTSPVFTVSQEQIKLSNSVNIENLLNELPQVIPGANSTSNNPSLQGRATIDLRGLGPGRTLVLVDGHRVVPARNDNIVDLNVIPASLIKKVEVVTGGTSAVYGSDAIGGVVNFIMRDDFEGVQVDGLGGISDKGDASYAGFNVTTGGKFANDKGSASLYASYFKREKLLASERDFAANQGPYGVSSRIEETRVDRQSGNPYDLDAYNDAGFTDLCASGNTAGICNDADGDGNRDYIIGGASNIAFNQDGTISGPAGGYNYAPVNDLILPQTRIITRGHVDYALSEHMNFNMTTLFSDNRIEQQLAPTPVSGVAYTPGTSPFETPEFAALLASRADPTADVLVRRRTTEVGNRISRIDRKIYQIEFGINGDFDALGNNWLYDLYYAYNRVDANTENFNNVSEKRFKDALAGCPTGSDVGCVAANIFGKGNISAAAADFIRLRTATDLLFERNIVAGYIAGDFGDAFQIANAGPIGFSAGFEFRDDASVFDVSDAQRLGNIQGFNAINGIKGKDTVWEVYAETSVPLINSDMIGMKSLNLEAGYRYSNYDSTGGVNAWKIGGDWVPIDGMRVRAMFNRAVRAPNIFELFRAGDQSFPSYGDPCNTIAADGTPITLSAAVLDECARQIGVTAAVASAPGGVFETGKFRQSDTQVETRAVGNPNLREETSDTFTLGVVYQPSFVPGLSLSVDYFDYKVTDFVGSVGSSTILSSCFGDPTNPAVQTNFCSKIARNATSGEIDVIDTTIDNLLKVTTSGIDVNVVYQADFDDMGPLSAIPGSFSNNFLLTWVDEFSTNGSNSVGQDFGFGGQPEWKVSNNLTYRPIPELSLNWEVTWFSKLLAPQPFGGFFVNVLGEPANLPDYMTHDFGFSYQVNDTFSVYGGVDNAFNKQPPNSRTNSGLAFSGQSGTDPSQYDIIGRFWRIGFSKSF